MRERFTTITVSFRLSPELAALLDEAAQAAGQSRGECARELVSTALSGEREDELASTIESVRNEVNDLRRDIVSVLESLLLNVANVSPDDVRELLGSIRAR